MALIIYSKSTSFVDHINRVVDGEVIHRSILFPVNAEPDDILLVYAPSFVEELPAWLEEARLKSIIIGVATDIPSVEDLLSFTNLGVQGYFNAHMSAPNYSQMLRLLTNGQSWYPPPLLSQAFELARSAIKPPPANNLLETLTKRERDVALAVAEGKSNKLVASTCNMAERTVKAHLTQIFQKLKVKDRVALVIYLGQFDSLKPNKSSTG